MRSDRADSYETTTSVDMHEIASISSGFLCVSYVYVSIELTFALVCHWHKVPYYNQNQRCDTSSPG